MMVTVVVPTHRRPDLLARALDTVGAQTLRPAEVLVVDDAVDPATKDVVDAAAQRWRLPLVYLPHAGGTGASSSRNAGAAAAGGDVLAFLDDDDRWSPCYLEEAAAALHGGADSVVTWIQVFHGDRAGEGFEIPSGLCAADVLARNPGVTGSNLLVRREVFAALGGFDERLWVSNDKDFLIRLLDAGYRYGVVRRRFVDQCLHARPRLTSGPARRARGLQRFYAKYEARLSPADRRYLRFQLQRVLRRSARRRSDRLRHTLRMLGLLGPAELGQVVAAVRMRVRS